MAPIKITKPQYVPVLKQTGENIFDINPELGLEHVGMRKTISAAQAWPVAGDWGVKTFFAFPNLPKELRNRIWRFAASSPDFEPRVVNIFVVDGKLDCNAITPRVLHTCSEARQEALFVYDQLVFNGVKTVCYVNFHIDWVFFDTNVPLIKVFGATPEYPIFQEKCRRLAMLPAPANVYAKNLRRFGKLEELAIVGIPTHCYDPHGGGSLGNVKSFPVIPLAPRDQWETTLLEEKKRIENDVLVPVTLVHVWREESSKIIGGVEKERARMKRKYERDAVAKLRVNESSAYQLQYEIDLRKVKVEVQECPFEDPDDEEDEFGFGMGLGPEFFSEDFMNYG